MTKPIKAPTGVSGKHPRVVRHRHQENSRIFALKFGYFFQLLSQRQTELYNGDYGLLIVAWAIVTANIGVRMRDPNFQDAFRSLDTVIGLEQQRGCNALSIAESTGLPRETVRRKIKRLVDMGIVARRDTGDYVMQPGVVQSPTFTALFLDLSDIIRRFVNECIAEEIFAVEGSQLQAIAPADSAVLDRGDTTARDGSSGSPSGN